MRPVLAGRAARLYAQLDFLVEPKDEAERDLLQESRKHAIVRILETAPGMGPIRAARLVPIVVTPHRFRTKRQFWSHCGFGIVMRSSSDWVRTADGAWIRAQVPQTRGLTRQHNRVLKDIFKGAATTVLTQRKDVIYTDYERLLAAGTKPSLAKLTLARTIAATVLCMWKNEEAYQPEAVPKVHRSRPHVGDASVPRRWIAIVNERRGEPGSEGSIHVRTGPGHRSRRPHG